MTKWSGERDKAIFTHVLLIGVPTLFYYCLRLGGVSLNGVHVFIATFFFISSIMLLVESTTAIFRRFATNDIQLKPGRDRFLYSLKTKLGIRGAEQPISPRPVPRCTFLIAAYLPNEQEIIFETLMHVLQRVQRPIGGLEVILAYNTPVDLPIEEDLRRLAQTYPELVLLRVEGSRSKAENLNEALNIATGEVACVLDADHHPAADCFVRAWHWLEQGYDVIQGRNVIRNHAQNLLTQTVAIEFEMMYGICHTAKSLMTDSSIFGGSNGYWRMSVLKQIRFNPIMLTEDIDASLRTLLNGYRILHDRSIITSELAPMDLQAFWVQRKRWAQGWLEVSLKYQRRIWRSKHLTLWQKVYWTYLLYYCDFFSLISLQIFPIFLSLGLYQGQVPPSDNPYLMVSTVIALFSCFYQTYATAKVAAVRYRPFYYIQHGLLFFPYLMLKNVIAIVGLYDHLHGNNNWLVTPRSRKMRRRSAANSKAIPAPKASILSSTKP